MRRVVGPVWANLTGTVSPTDRCLDCRGGRVDEQLAGGQGGRGCPPSSAGSRVSARCFGGHRGERGERVLELELPAVDGGGRGDARHGRCRGRRHRVAELPEPVADTMRSALIAWSTLLVADFDSDAPNTAIAETRARPTMSADGGLGGAPRAAHGVLPPELARFPEQPRPADARSRRTAAARSPGPAWRRRRTWPTAPTPTSCDGRLGQPDGQQDHADQGQRPRPR